MQTKPLASQIVFFRMLRYTHRFLHWVLATLIGVIMLVVFVCSPFVVRGQSMEPTLRDGQIILVWLLNQRAYPKNTVVIVEYAGDYTIRFVKRIVGAPGDVVIHNGSEYLLRKDEYYVVGDNLDHSTDSRDYGPIHRSQIVGAVFMY